VDKDMYKNGPLNC